MAQVYGNPNQSYSGNGGTDYGHNKYILKDEYKKNWFIYRSAGGSFVRPYPVFDQTGNPCPSRNDNSDTADYTMLPEAFAVLSTVSFAGVNGDLELVDYCTDIDSYLPPGVDYLRTPFTTLIVALRKMLPPKNGPQGIGSDKYPTPRQLLQIQKNISYPVSTIMFRGALCRHKGNPMATKASVDGVLFNTVFCITQKSATDSFYAQLNQTRDFNYPISATNNMFDSMFNLKGVGIQFNKGAQQSDGYQVSAFFDQNYESTACRKFGCDPAGYHNALREFFGPAQRVGDMIKFMTVAEMVDVIKANYPISWIWYAFKDSPYANFITQEERTEAMSDPEMAQRFGLIGGNSAPQVNYTPPTPPATPTYPQQAYQAPVNTPPPPAPTPSYPQEPSWNSAGYSTQESFRGEVPSNAEAAGYPPPSVGNTPTVPSGVPSNGTTSAAMNDFLTKYGVKPNAGIPDPDGIKY